MPHLWEVIVEQSAQRNLLENGMTPMHELEQQMFKGKFRY